MKRIELQVGKTYRSREGEEVKIIKKSNPHNHPFQGSNGGLYAENGRWGYGSEERPEDLIEEVPEHERIMAFLQRYGENVKWNYKQLCLLIECYLNHREGEK